MLTINKSSETFIVKTLTVYCITECSQILNLGTVLSTPVTIVCPKCKTEQNVAILVTSHKTGKQINKELGF